MGATYFTREYTDAIMRIAFELERMNDLKEKELLLKYGRDSLEQ